MNEWMESGEKVAAAAAGAAGVEVFIRTFRDYMRGDVRSPLRCGGALRLMAGTYRVYLFLIVP